MVLGDLKLCDHRKMQQIISRLFNFVEDRQEVGGMEGLREVNKLTKMTRANTRNKKAPKSHARRHKMLEIKQTM